MAHSPLMKRLANKAKAAVSDFVAGGDHADAIGMAMRGVQQGRKVIDESTMRVLGTLGVATQSDLARIEKRIGKLRKRLLVLLEQAES